MQWFVKTYLINPEYSNTVRSVLDVGSYDENGTYKPLFNDSLFKYTGLDMVAGPNVDIVLANTYSWDDIPDEEYDIVISGQVLEHAEFCWVTMSEMVRVLKRGGMLCLIVPGSGIRHRYPVDCYRFDVDGVIALAKYTNLEVLHASRDLAPPGAPAKWYDHGNEDTMLVAKKPIDWDGNIDPKEYIFTQNDIEALATGFITEEEQLSHLESIPADPEQESLKKKEAKKAEKIESFNYYDLCRFDLLAMITHDESAPISVLEVGCSTGKTLEMIRDTWVNASVRGVELVPEIAEEAKKRGLDVLCCNVEEVELPFEKESFDYIILGDVVEHLREPEETLLDLLEFLKKGGSVLCSVPNVMHGSVVNNLIKGKFEYVDAGILDKTHLRFFTLHSVRQLFSNINMKIEMLLGNTWTSNGADLTDIYNEEIDSEKLFTFQQILVSARKY